MDERIRNLMNEQKSLLETQITEKINESHQGINRKLEISEQRMNEMKTQLCQLSETVESMQLVQSRMQNGERDEEIRNLMNEQRGLLETQLTEKINESHQSIDRKLEINEQRMSEMEAQIRQLSETVQSVQSTVQNTAFPETKIDKLIEACNLLRSFIETPRTVTNNSLNSQSSSSSRAPLEQLDEATLGENAVNLKELVQRVKDKCQYSFSLDYKITYLKIMHSPQAYPCPETELVPQSLKELREGMSLLVSKKMTSLEISTQFHSVSDQYISQLSSELQLWKSLTHVFLSIYCTGVQFKTLTMGLRELPLEKLELRFLPNKKFNESDQEVFLGLSSLGGQYLNHLKHLTLNLCDNGTDLNLINKDQNLS